MRLLWNHGLSLKKARDALEHLANERPAVVELNTDAPNLVSSELGKLGILHGILEIADIDVKTLREEQQLSQPDFARWYGLEVDTVRNWEQHRYKVEGAAKVLLNVINYEPQAVIRAQIRQQLLNKWKGTFKHREWEGLFIHNDSMAPEIFGESFGRPKEVPPDGYIWVLQRKQSHAD